MRRIVLIIVLSFLVYSPAQDSTEQILFPFKKDGLWGYMDTTGRIAMPAKYSRVGNFIGGYAFVKEGNKMGALNTSFDLVLPIEYKKIDVLGGGYFALAEDSLLYLSHVSRKVENEHYYRNIRWIGDRTFAMNEGSGWQLINEQGELLHSRLFHDFEYIDTHYIKTTLKGKEGLITHKGEELLSPTYEQVKLTNGKQMAFCGSYQDWNYFHLASRTKGSESIYDFEQLDERYIVFKAYEGEMLFDAERFDYVTTSGYHNYRLAKNNFISFSKGMKLGLIDRTTGQIMVEPKYDRFIPLDSSKVLVSIDKKFGIVTYGGEVIVPIEYKSLGKPNALGFMVCEMPSGLGVIDSVGNTILKPKYQKVNLNNESAFVVKDSLIWLIDFDEKGQIIERNQFSGFVELKSEFRLMQPGAPGFLNTLGSLTDSLGNFWWKDKTCGMWGIMSKDSIVIMEPQFKRVQPIGNTRYTLIPLPGRKDLRYNQFDFDALNTYQVVDLRKARFALRQTYTYVHTPDIRSGSRVVRAKDDNGIPTVLQIIDNRLQKISKEVTYVDFKSGDRFRVAYGGKMHVQEKRDKTTIDALPRYFKELRANLTTKERALLFTMKGSKWGILHLDGVWEAPPEFDFIKLLNNEQSIVCKENKWGVEGRAGNVIPLKYDFVWQNEGSGLYVLESYSNKKGFVDSAGTPLGSKLYDNLNHFNDGYFTYGKARKGIIDYRSKSTLDGVFRKVYSLADGVFKVKGNKGIQFFTVSGDSLPMPKSREASDYGCERVFIKIKGKYKLFSGEGVQVSDQQFKMVKAFVDNYAAVKQKKKWFFVDTDCKKVSRYQYRRLYGFNNLGYAVVQKGKKLGVVNRKGELVVNPNLPRGAKLLDTLVLYPKKGGIEVKSLLNGKAYPLLFEKVGGFKDGLLSVRYKGKWGLVDEKGRFAIDPIYDHLAPSYDGVAVFKKKGKYGLVDTNGNVIKTAQFRRISNFSEGRSWAESFDGQTLLLDTLASIIWKGKLLRTWSFENGYAVVQSINGYGTIDKDGFELAPLNSSYLERTVNGRLITSNKVQFQIGNTKGEVAEGNDFHKIEHVTSNIPFYRVEKFDRVGYISSKGKWLLPPQN